MKIIITGGGTGGHIYPGISLARAFQKRDEKNKIIFIGTNQGMEAEIIPKEGYIFYALKVKGIRRKICLDSFYAILLFLISLFTSLRFIREIRPDLVIGTGGYVSGSVALVSSLVGIPTFIHEQNAIPGITNQLLSLTCRKIFVSFPESRDYLWRKGKAVFLGNPVRENIWQGDRNKIIGSTGLVADKKTLLVFGGSRGASVINQTLLDTLDKMDRSFWREWQILIISGKDDYLPVKERLKHYRYQKNIAVISYLNQMEDAYDLADLVICRAGATTIAELTAKGLPAILIPYPYATGNHQFVNASHLAKMHAAVVIPEKELSAGRLSLELEQFLNHKERLAEFTDNSRLIGNRKAADDIISKICSELGRNNPIKKHLNIK